MWGCENVNVDLQIRGCEDVDVQLRVGRCRAADVGQISAQNQCAHAPWNQTKTVQLLPKTHSNNAPRLRTIRFPKSSIPPCRQWYSQSYVCVELSLKLTQKARYQHAANNWHDLIVAWKFPWKSPKKLSTNMPWTIGMISLLHGNFHESPLYSKILSDALYFEALFSTNPLLLNTLPEISTSDHLSQSLLLNTFLKKSLLLNLFSRNLYFWALFPGNLYL